MKRSESIVNISQALLKAQKKIEKVTKDASNPFFKSKYADLPAVLEACKEHLNNEGILLMQPPAIEAEGEIVETYLIHAETGEFFQAEMKLINLKDMQAYGSGVSYARRYTIISMLGMCADDDDGEKTMSRPKQSSHEVKLSQATLEASANSMGQGFRKKPSNGGL